MSSYSRLLSPLATPTLSLVNRIAMNPMTRSRCAGGKGEMEPFSAQYYADRAGPSGAGLIITEGVSPSPNGMGYARMPGLYTAGQIASWSPITSAVRGKGSKIFIQLMHCGRIVASENLPAGARCEAPSDLLAAGQMWTDVKGMQPHAKPIALTIEDIKRVQSEFVKAADAAVNQAGFDGVELHSANGYLLEQFLSPLTNTRTDAYGGSNDKRNQFILELAKQVVDKIGPQRVGVRLSPYGIFNDMKQYAEQDAQYISLAQKLSELKIAYLHVLDHSATGAPAVPDSIKAELRKAFKGNFILAGGFGTATPIEAEKALQDGKADIIGIGRALLSNPDYTARIQQGKPLNDPDYTTLYTPGEQGYNTYPKLA